MRLWIWQNQKIKRGISVVDKFRAQNVCSRAEMLGCRELPEVRVARRNDQFVDHRGTEMITYRWVFINRVVYLTGAGPTQYKRRMIWICGAHGKNNRLTAGDDRRIHLDG